MFRPEPYWQCPAHGKILARDTVRSGEQQYCRLCLQRYLDKQRDELIQRVGTPVTFLGPTYPHPPGP